MRNYRSHSHGLRHLYAFNSFRERADLIDFDQDRIRDLEIDSFFQEFGISDKKIVADQLNLCAHHFRQTFPSVQSFSARPSSIETIGYFSTHSFQKAIIWSLDSLRPSDFLKM